MVLYVIIINILLLRLPYSRNINFYTIHFESSVVNLSNLKRFTADSTAIPWKYFAIYPLHYTHGHIVTCFLSAISQIKEQLPQWHWSNDKWNGRNRSRPTTTKHNKTRRTIAVWIVSSDNTVAFCYCTCKITFVCFPSAGLGLRNQVPLGANWQWLSVPLDFKLNQFQGNPREFSKLQNVKDTIVVTHWDLNKMAVILHS